MTKSPGAFLPSQHKILPTPDLDFAEDSDEQGLTEGHHAHPCAALVLLLLPWCQPIFIDDNSQEALGGRAQTGSPHHQCCISTAASSREPARLHWGSSILWYSRRLQQRYPSNLYTQKSLRNWECHWSPWSSSGMSCFTPPQVTKESSTGIACKNDLQLR